MPHITLEYSDNVSLDFKLFFEELKNKLVETGYVSAMGIKCRAVPSTVHFIIDGNPSYKMVNLLLRLREGRSLEVRKKLSQIGISLLEKYFQKEITNKEIILSTEVKELITGLDITKNAIR
ncbi:5-carboxymethyl-2-hydroxymuconate Delta-isomerase [Aquimarina hainanensis]|uniref:5-carboxymethyl-2-hydroxymuconate Delta-isomerase n=1 Tax=Aquimarina hainanensis TaxID=1578017 RepID=A0ABW5N721_9FLAO|nr:hypothetical protein [Aquimarina sp. TRL1]QKX05446.1 hypothetical protein HN014_11145 [Aquimarina sp. TRL1]